MILRGGGRHPQFRISCLELLGLNILTITGGSLASSSNADIDLRFFNAKYHPRYDPSNRFALLVVCLPWRHGHNNRGLDIGPSAYYNSLARNLINAVTTKFAVPKSGPHYVHRKESYWTLQYVLSLLVDNVDVQTQNQEEATNHEGK